MGDTNDHKSNSHSSSDPVYCSTRIRGIKCVYFVALVSWIILALSLGLIIPNWIILLILMIPVIVFIIALYNLPRLSCQVEREMFKTNYLNLSLLVVLPILIWMNKDYNGDRAMFIRIIVVAMALTFISIIDIWVPMSRVSIVNHFKSSLHTMSVTLLIYAFYIYHEQRTSTG